MVFVVVALRQPPLYAPFTSPLLLIRTVAHVPHSRTGVRVPRSAEDISCTLERNSQPSRTCTGATPAERHERARARRTRSTGLACAALLVAGSVVHLIARRRCRCWWGSCSGSSCRRGRSRTWRGSRRRAARDRASGAGRGRAKERGEGGAGARVEGGPSDGDSSDEGDGDSSGEGGETMRSPRVCVCHIATRSARISSRVCVCVSHRHALDQDLHIATHPTRIPASVCHAAARSMRITSPRAIYVSVCATPHRALSIAAAGRAP